MLDRGTQEAVAGLTAGMATTLAAHPLDFVKLRLQLDTSRRPQWQSFVSIYRNVVDISRTSEGVLSITKLTRNVYRGLGPNLLGATAAWGMYFAFYRQYKNVILRLNGLPKDASQGLKPWHYLASAFAAGWSTAILTNPIWVLKTRMISTDRSSTQAYQSMLDGIRRIHAKEGLLGFYRGLTPALLNVAQGAVQLSIYDLLKDYKLQKGRMHDKLVLPRERLDTVEYLYLSAISKMVATCAFYPLQVIRARLQVSTGTVQGPVALSVAIFTAEGVTGFYKGLAANLCRVVPATCLTFVVYEETKHLLSL